MATPYTPPEYTRYSRSEWQEAAATPRGADMILNPEKYAQYVSAGPLIGFNSMRVAPDVELRRDFRNRPQEFGTLMTTAARTDPEAALKSEYLVRLEGGVDVMRDTLATVSPSTAQEVVAYWAERQGGRDFITMAATVQPEAVLRGMGGYEGILRYANWDEQAMQTAATTLAQRDPQRALALANEFAGSEYSMQRNGMDAVVAALSNGQELTPQRATPVSRGERGDIPYDEALAEMRGVPVEEIRTARTSAAPTVSSDNNQQRAVAAALDGVDASNGFNAREKQMILEAAGFATDKGGVDGRVDGQYGTRSRNAEASLREGLVDGSLNGINPEVLAMARAAFAPTTAAGMTSAEAGDVQRAAGGGQSQAQGQGAAR